MPIPEFLFDNEAGGTPPKAVPVRFACLAADLPPALFASILAGNQPFSGINVYEYDETQNEAGEVHPDRYSQLFHNQQGQILGELELFPANHFVWSDDLVHAYSNYIDTTSDRQSAFEQRMGIRWRPALKGYRPVIDACPDLSSLIKDEVSQNVLPSSSNQNAPDLDAQHPVRCILAMKIPIRKDEWFHVISASIKNFEHQHQYTPNELELWHKLRTLRDPFIGEIRTSRMAGEEHLTLDGAKALGRQSFKKRYKRLYSS